jgi:hypothetical protein
MRRLGPRCGLAGLFSHGLGQERTHAPQQFPSPLGYSITSSASARSVSGTVRPSALAVLTLIISSNFVGSWTGRPFEQN